MRRTSIVNKQRFIECLKKIYLWIGTADRCSIFCLHRCAAERLRRENRIKRMAINSFGRSNIHHWISIRRLQRRRHTASSRIRRRNTVEKNSVMIATTKISHLSLCNWVEHNEEMRRADWRMHKRTHIQRSGSVINSSEPEDERQ